METFNTENFKQIEENVTKATRLKKLEKFLLKLQEDTVNVQFWDKPEYKFWTDIPATKIAVQDFQLLSDRNNCVIRITYAYRNFPVDLLQGYYFRPRPKVN